MAKAPPWSHKVLARIYLRSIKGDEEPSEEAVETLLSENLDILTRKTVTGDQISAAYTSGKEVRFY